MAAFAFALATVGPAIAYVCHPDRPGTRTMSLRGAVAIDAMHGSRVSLTVRRAGTCHRVAWDVATGRSRATSCSTLFAARTVAGYRARIEGGSVAVYDRGALLRRIWIGYTPLPLRAVASRTCVFVLTAPAANGPARLLGFDARSGLKTIDYPVPYSGRTLDVAAGVAIFGTTGGSGLFGLRLADGTISFLGVERSHDNPQIERAGIVYGDNMYPRYARAGIAKVKFVPIVCRPCGSCEGRPHAADAGHDSGLRDGRAARFPRRCGHGPRVRSNPPLEHPVALHLIHHAAVPA